MKCTVSKSVLHEMLAKVQGFTEKKSTLAILSHVLLEAQDNELRVKATDLHTSIQVTASCEVHEQGACTVSAKGLLDVVSVITVDTLELHTDDDARVHIAAGKVNTNLNIMDAEEYPLVDFSELSNGLEVDPQAIKFMVDRVVFSIPASADNDAKYTLSGALLVTGGEGDDRYIEMVTTDTRRLSVARHELVTSLDMGDGIIVPRKGVQELKRLIDEREENARILLTGNSIFYQSDNTIATVRLIDGKFPDYQGVVNIDSYPVTATVNALELIEALKVCATMVSDTTNCVRFSFAKDRIVLYSHNPEKGEVTIDLDARHEGEEMEINFNPRYFLDCLNIVEGEAVIRLKGGQGPCLVTPTTDTNSRWVIMPMRF